MLVYCTSRSQQHSAKKQSNRSCKEKNSLCKTNTLFKTYPSLWMATGPCHLSWSPSLPPSVQQCPLSCPYLTRVRAIEKYNQSKGGSCSS